MERRDFPRLKTQISARILVNNQTAGEGLVFDLSAGGVGVYTDLEVDVNDCIVIQLYGGRRFEGNVSRLFDGGFAVKFNMTETKRAMLADMLKPKLEQMDEITELRPEYRTTTRTASVNADIECHIGEGTVQCDIIDMSLAGAAIKCKADIELGATVTLGKMRGKVVHSNGEVHGIQFLPPGSDLSSDSVDALVACPDENAKRSG